MMDEKDASIDYVQQSANSFEKMLDTKDEENLKISFIDNMTSVSQIEDMGSGVSGFVRHEFQADEFFVLDQSPVVNVKVALAKQIEEPVVTELQISIVDPEIPDDS